MKYRIEIGSPPEFDELVAYIILEKINNQAESHEFALLSQDNGPENIEVIYLLNR